MNHETEMYHAAIKILNNRAYQLNDDELMHTYAHINIYNKYDYQVPQEDVDKIIDSKINSIPSDIGKILNELNNEHYKDGPRDEKQRAATKRLWNTYIDRITKEVGNALRSKEWKYTSDDALQQMVVNRFTTRYPRLLSIFEWFDTPYNYTPHEEDPKDKAIREKREKEYNDTRAKWKSRDLIKRGQSDKAGAKREQDEAARNNRMTTISKKNKLLRDINTKKDKIKL